MLLRAAAGLSRRLGHQSPHQRAAAAAAAGLLPSSRGLAAHAGEVHGVPTGPQGGYNDPGEAAILDASEGQHQEDQRNAERLAHQAS